MMRTLLSNDSAHSIAVQPDRKIVVAGIDRRTSDYLVARYLENGMLDVSFGEDGMFSIPGSHGVLAIDGITVREDGEILVATRAGSATTVYAISGAGDRWFRQSHQRVVPRRRLPLEWAVGV